MGVNRDYSKNYNIGGGELYVKTKDETNFRYFGATNDIKLNFKTDKIEHKSSENSTLVTDLEVVKEVSAELSFTTEDLNKEVLASAFGGKYETIHQDNGSETDYEIDGVKGLYVYSLDNKVKVNNVVVRYKDGDDDKVAVEDVDYSVDYNFGKIEIAKGGAIDGKDIKVDFDYASIDITNFTALDDVSKTISLRVAQKLQNGQVKEFLIHKVQLSLNGDYDLKNNEKLTSLAFSGKVLQDITQPEGKQFVETKMIG